MEGTRCEARGLRLVSGTDTQGSVRTNGEQTMQANTSLVPRSSFLRTYFLHALGCAFSYTFLSFSAVTWVYICVVERFSWPNSSLTASRSAPALSRWVAKVWRST